MHGTHAHTNPNNEGSERDDSGGRQAKEGFFFFFFFRNDSQAGDTLGTSRRQSKRGLDQRKGRSKDRKRKRERKTTEGKEGEKTAPAYVRRVCRLAPQPRYF